MTEAVLDTAAQSATTLSGAASGSTRPPWRCPECLTAFRPKQGGQLFCCRVHKRIYNNRWLARGAVLAPLYAAARTTRGGSRGDRETGAKARRDADQLVQKWKDEDAAEGRMPAVEYVAKRYRLGLVNVI